MGKGEWIALGTLFFTVMIAAATGFVANESRISKLEAQDEEQDRRILIMVKQQIEQTQKTARLEGMHEGHLETTTHAGQ